MPKPSHDHELLKRVREVVQDGPSRVPAVLEAVSDRREERGRVRAAIEHLVQRGELEFDVQMMLRPVR